ncbi:MAG TPA: hypothetical protein VKA46_11060 [Gemmataceae bacterium]|nr:hypothetical protein [Gemmataceae bacterium]
MAAGPEFIRRANEWTPEQLAPYEGKFVAWSEDGDKILATGTTREELDAEVRRLSLTAYVESYVPTPEEIRGGFR